MIKKILCLIIIFLTLVTISFADSPPPLPNTFRGTVRFVNLSGYYDAPVGTQIDALIDNDIKGNTVAKTAGNYEIDVIGTENDDNKSIIFRIEGRNAGQKAIFNASNPHPSILNLVVNISSYIRIDIKPESYPNSINPKSSGVIPVAILSSEDFNATSKVNVSSVRFAPSGAKESHNTGHFEQDVNNDSYLDIVLHFDTQDTGISCGDTFVKLIGMTFDGIDIEGSDSIETVECQDSQSGGGNSGSSGGGGGGIFGESFSNIELKEQYDEIIYKDKLTSYRFKNASNPVMYINITGNVNAGLITTMVEVLKGTSSLVNEAAPGIVYENINLWAGTSGFSTSKNIKETTVMFKVENSWIDNNAFERSDIKLVKYQNRTWIILETSEIFIESIYTYFNARTDSFSCFAITGIKIVPSGAIMIANAPEPMASEGTMTEIGSAPAINLWLISILIFLISIVVGIYILSKK